MKKTLLTLALTAVVASTGMAQGFVLFSNSGSEKISVNAIMGGPATGAMPTTSTYYFALFYSATATTVDGSAAAVTGYGNYVFNDSNWTFNNPTAAQANGYVYGPGYGQNDLRAGQFASSYIDPTQSATLVPFTTPAQFVVVGWSANIGSTLDALENWYGMGDPITPGWIGESAVSGAITPGTPDIVPASPPAILFDSFAGELTGFTLGIVVPEPSMIALAGLGGLSLLLFRRRK
jgi:hypothetical protein